MISFYLITGIASGLLAGIVATSVIVTDAYRRKIDDLRAQRDHYKSAWGKAMHLHGLAVQERQATEDLLSKATPARAPNGKFVSRAA